MRSGDQLGRWHLVEQLGHGANAVVWRAECDDGHVAIKVLRARKAASEQYVRFRQEIDALKLLSGIPGVLPLSDFHLPIEPTSADPAWLAMPIAIPIVDALGDNPTIERVVAAVADFADALTRAAERGVYHRDIKPANLYEFGGRACIGDFGLAAVPDRAELTADGKKLGPMWYLAPEMLNDAASADAGLADVYSLGKSLWVLASGQRYPFPGEMGDRSLQLTNFTGDPRAPILDSLVSRCCAHNPKDRPAIASVAGELRSFLAMGAAPTSPGQDVALTSRFTMLRKAMLDVDSKHGHLITLRDELRRRLESAANGLVLATRETTGLAAQQSGENHIGTLLPAPELQVPRAGTYGALVVIDSPRPLGATNLLFFGGFSLVTTHGSEVAVDAAFGFRGAERIFAQKRSTGLLGTADLEIKVEGLQRWAAEMLNAALGEFGNLLEARTEQLKQQRGDARG